LRRKRGKIHDPLHLAVRRASVKEIASVLAQGHDIETPDDEGRTGLFYAAYHGHEAVINELVRNGADLNARDEKQKTPLHFAAQEFQLGAAALLVAKGAKIDTTDEDLNTPLSDAVFYSRGRGDMIKLLLRLGADRNIKNRHGVSPLELANTISNYKVDIYFKK